MLTRAQIVLLPLHASNSALWHFYPQTLISVLLPEATAYFSPVAFIWPEPTQLLTTGQTTRYACPSRSAFHHWLPGQEPLLCSCHGLSSVCWKVPLAQKHVSMCALQAISVESYFHCMFLSSGEHLPWLSLNQFFVVQTHWMHNSEPTKWRFQYLFSLPFVSAVHIFRVRCVSASSCWLSVCCASVFPGMTHFCGMNFTQMCWYEGASNTPSKIKEC